MSIWRKKLETHDVLHTRTLPDTSSETGCFIWQSSAQGLSAWSGIIDENTRPKHSPIDCQGIWLRLLPQLPSSWSATDLSENVFRIMRHVLVEHLQRLISGISSNSTSAASAASSRLLRFSSTRSSPNPLYS
eukprot:s637_g32.t1